MKSSSLALLSFILLLTIQLQAQPSTKVYYFVDAVSEDSTSSQGKRKMYLHSLPTASENKNELNPEALISSFKRAAQLKYGITRFSSCVLRTNETEEQARTLWKNYTDKFVKKNYTVVEVEL